jgi:hypothetical protein
MRKIAPKILLVTFRKLIILHIPNKKDPSIRFVKWIQKKFLKLFDVFYYNWLDSSSSISPIGLYVKATEVCNFLCCVCYSI